MTLALYLIVEGVTDACLAGRVLLKRFGAVEVDDFGKLTPRLRAWIENNYKWPHKGKINRLSVPVPKLYILPDGRVVAIANGTGVSQMKDVAVVDQGALDLQQVRPDAVAAILDDDGKGARQVAVGFDVLAPFLQTQPTDPKSGQVLPGPPRHGVLVVPEPPGLTVDTILDELGRAAYPRLHTDAADLVARWVPLAHGPDFADLRAPAGAVKARLAVMGALLKPMKPFGATLDDHGWVREERLEHSSLKPLITFLEALLAVKD